MTIADLNKLFGFTEQNPSDNESTRYKVLRVFKNSSQRVLLRRNLTLDEAKAMVKQFPTRPRSMVVFTRDE